jgi:RNA ligase
MNTPLLSVVIPDEVLSGALRDKLVSARNHPVYPYTLLTYTQRAVWEGVWNEATVNSRGLIYNHETGHIVARPFRKFFNYNQPGAPEDSLTTPVVVTDKMDGSLGILTPAPGGGEWFLATKGSFLSEQAEHATLVWERQYAARFTPTAGYTYLFEIVYPLNRIVVNYGNTDNLILIGCVNNITGRSVPLNAMPDLWPGLVAETLPANTLGDALTLPPRVNAEGVVIWNPATDTRVKLKQQDYIKLHKLLTGVTPNKVWETLAAGEQVETVLETAPDEFHGWVKKTVTELTTRHAALLTQWAADHETVMNGLPAGWVRKDYAMAIAKHPNKSAMFVLLDGGTPVEQAWKAVHPNNNTAFWNDTDG